LENGAAVPFRHEQEGIKNGNALCRNLVCRREVNFPRSASSPSASHDAVAYIGSYVDEHFVAVLGLFAFIVGVFDEAEAVFGFYTFFGTGCLKQQKADEGHKNHAHGKFQFRREKMWYEG
jgi:hypothetical protein